MQAALRKKLGTILVGSDLSRASDRLIRQAAEIAAMGGAELHVVSAYSTPSAGFGSRAGEVPAEVLDEVREALPAQLRRILNPSRTPVSGEVRFGKPSEVMLSRADEVSADAIVLGAHRGTDVHAQFLGTTADEVLRRAAVPCLRLRDGLSLPLRRVGVAADLSRSDELALRAAAEWLTWLGGGETEKRICVAHVYPHTYDKAKIDAIDARLRQTIASVAGDLSDPHWFDTDGTVVLRDNDVPGMLLRWADRNNLDMLVTGTRGRGGLRQGRIGSVSSALALRARCPVLLVPNAGRELEASADAESSGLFHKE
jgi:nucleotide-binding universal stress UspA family protein